MLALLVTMRIMTSVMSPADVGTVNQITALAVLFASAFIAPITTYFSRGFLGWRDAGELSAKMQRLLRTVLGAAIAFGFVAFAADFAFTLVPQSSAIWVFALVFLYLAAYSMHVAVISGASLLGERAIYTGLQNLAAWGGLGFAVVLFQFARGPELWLLGLYAGFMVSALAWFWLRTHAARVSSAGVETGERLPFSTKAVFTFAWPQAVAYSLWWTQSQSYRFILDDISGLATVGLFFAAYALCSIPMQMFETLFNEYYAPTLYGGLKNASRENWVRVWNNYASAYVPAVILFGMFLIAIGPHLAVLLLGEEFRRAGDYVFWPALAETARAISSSLYTMGIIKVDMRINIPPMIAGAVIAPFFVYLLAPAEPLLGTSQALFLGSVAALVIVVVVSRRALNVSWPLRRICLAGLAGIPLLIVAWAVDYFAPVSSVITALAVFSATGIYVAIAQYSLASSWIRRPFNRAI